jgi:type II secretory pathway component PulC
MLFSQDRNPNVVVDVAPPKPLPPLPVAHGMVNFGGGPMVILSERPGAPHRTYSAGEKIGEFTLVAINNDGVVLEFDGREIKKSLQELRGSAEGQPPVQAEQAPPPQQAVTTVETVVQPPAQTTVETPSVQSGPGVVISGQVRACLPNDPSPPGTVIDGLRKLVNQTPFGKVCRWEPVE